MELLAGINDRKSRIGEVVSNVLMSLMKMTWFHAMELVKEARLPSYPLGVTHSHVNLHAPISNPCRFSVLSDCDENDLAQVLVKWKEIKCLPKSLSYTILSCSLTRDISCWSLTMICV